MLGKQMNKYSFYIFLCDINFINADLHIANTTNNENKISLKVPENCSQTKCCEKYYGVYIMICLSLKEDAIIKE